MTAILTIIAATEIEYADGSIQIHKKSAIPQHVVATIPGIKAKIEIYFIDSANGTN